MVVTVRRRNAGRYHPEFRHDQPPTTAHPPGKGAIPQWPWWREWWDDGEVPSRPWWRLWWDAQVRDLKRSLSPFLFLLFFVNVILVALKWLMTLVFLGGAFLCFCAAVGLLPSVTRVGPAGSVGAEVGRVAGGVILLAFGVLFLLMTPEDMSKLGRWRSGG